MTDNPQFFFVCLPYLNLGEIDEIDFGFAKIWNYNKLSTQYISDIELRNQINKVLSNYKTQFGTVNGIGIALTGKNDFRNYSEKDFQDIEDARLILFISFLSHNNTTTRDSNSGHQMGSSENFESIRFAVVKNTESMSEFGGFVVPFWHGGINIEDNRIIRPRHILTPRFEIDQELFNSLISLKNKKPRIFRQFISSIQVFFESYYNTHQISENARILLQASAFEILLGISGEGRKEFKDFTKKFANYPDDKTYIYNSERRNGFEKERGTIKEMWADRFFSLRNHIIHGDAPSPSEFYFHPGARIVGSDFISWQRHFEIALYFYIFSLKRKIEIGLRKEIFNDDVVWKSWRDELTLPPTNLTGFVYEHYSRRAWEKLVRRYKKARLNK